jgi:Fur family peroxide stress response transcriptional regulator
MDAEAIKRSLQGSGLRCTPQRYAVMACLMEHTGHPTAAEILEAVNRVEGRAGRFDATGMRHHHFICDRCGNVEDVEWYDVVTGQNSVRL